jgi:outer membrane protein assembly factor BamB
MLIFAREDQGLTAIRLTKQGQDIVPQEVWNNKENELYMNSPVLQGNILFGMSVRKKGQFFSIDADTGKTLWQSAGRMGENVALLNTGKVLLLLTNEARLIVLPSSAKEYKPVAEYSVANSQTWAHPVATGNRILVKDETTLTSLTI